MKDASRALVERLAGHPGVGQSSRTAKLTVSFSSRTAARRRREDERERMRAAVYSMDVALSALLAVRS